MSHLIEPSTPSAGAPVAVSCVDAIGSARQVAVTRSGERVVLQTPPGEIAILDPASAGLLAGALHALTAPRPADPGTDCEPRRRP